MSKKIRKLIKKRRAGQNLVRLTYSGINKELQKKIKPPKNGQFDQRYFESLKKSVYPRGYKKRNRALFRLRGAIKKLAREKMSRQAFAKDQFGLILVKPELLPFTLDVRRFLRGIGCEIVFSKIHALNQSQLEAIYQPEMHQWQDFPINAAILTSGPSRVLVFKHATKDKYATLLRTTNNELYQKLKRQVPQMSAQELFHTAVKGLIDEGRPGTLRGDISHKRLKELGFGKMTGISRQLDPTGYLGQRVNEGKSVFNILTGIHSPATLKDLINHGVSLFTHKELSRLVRQLSKS